MNKKEVDTYIPRSLLKKKGRKAIMSICVDTDKGDWLKPNVLSIICVQWCKRGVNAPEKAVLCNVTSWSAAALDVAQNTKKCVQGWTGAVYRAFRHFSSAFHATSRERDVFVELPMEYPMKTRSYVERMERSMYGTQDECNLWQKEFTTLREHPKHVASRVQPSGALL